LTPASRPGPADRFPFDVVVYGASGFAQQVMFWIDDVRDAGWYCEVLGFVDDDPSTHGETRTDRPVLGGIDWIERRAADRPLSVVIGIADPLIKRRIVERLRPFDVVFPSIIHPSAVMSSHVKIARGVVVAPGSIISVNVELDEFALVNHACTVAHDVRLGAYATILPGSNVSGCVTIGGGATLGTNSTVIQGLAIGSDSFVGAGATVLRDLPPGVTAVGTPAVPIKRSAS
jgi:sugar O-acyltransferase (sialic acid O-acetyltransferase NeuD family)